jgi:hypothetical protein
MLGFQYHVFTAHAKHRKNTNIALTLLGGCVSNMK